MEENTQMEIDENNIMNPAKEPEKKKELKIKKRNLSWLVFLIFGVVFLLGGVSCILFAVLKPKEEVAEIYFPIIPSIREENYTYSALTGEILSDPALKNGPAYCIQIPNGLDGARPQVGLTQAGVVFEAIAEAGITRFAAIFQNPTTAVIGPIRSLRIYYLDWDTPFDCSIVHAGGAANALEAVRAGGYKDLTENYAYMYRGRVWSRLWNNLFTTSSDLAQFSADYGYTSFEIKGISRLTPAESLRKRVDALIREKLNIVQSSENNTSELAAKVSRASLSFGYVPGFNVVYDYDIGTNTYLRSFGTGVPHEVYKCADENLGEIDPEGNCPLAQLAPSSVVAMIVDEKKAPGGYYEQIATVGSGRVYIFQNGEVVSGVWEKADRGEQIRFFDDERNEIKLVPGQTIISAIPGYGSVDF